MSKRMTNRMAIAKRKKRFFDVEIPLIEKETQLQAFEKEELNGRILSYDLTRTLRGKSILLKSKIKVTDGKAIAISKSIKLMPYFLRRAVRKGTNYVEDSFSANCKDAQIKIKPFLVTRRKVSRAVRKALRQKAKQELINYVKNKNAEDLFGEIIKNQLQKPLSLKLKKIYPLALCEIRVLEIEKELEPSQKAEEKESTTIQEKFSQQKTEKLIKNKTKNKNMEEERKIENAAEEMTKDVEIENVSEPAEKEEVKKEIEKEVEEVIEKVEENKE